MFRDALPNDKDAFMTMVTTFYNSDAVSHAIDKKFMEQTFEKAMEKDPFLRLIIIEKDKEIAGYGLVSFMYSNEAGGMVLLVEELYIDSKFRGAGIGQEFFKFMKNEYKSFKRFRLEVKADNIRAIDLYKRLGYEKLEYIQMVIDN